jgi:hypothetical protein
MERIQPPNVMENGSVTMSFDKPLPSVVPERINFVNTRQGVFVSGGQNSAVEPTFLR